MCVDLRNRHRDHAHSGRRARAVGRLAAYRHNGAGSVQCFNAAGAQPPPGDGPGPGEAATDAQREGWWLVGWLSCEVAQGPMEVLGWGLLRRPSSAVRLRIVVTSPVLGARLLQAGDAVTVRTSGQRGGRAPTLSFVPFSPGPLRPSRRTRRSQRARRCSRWRSPPAAGERSPGAGSPVEGGPPGSHRGRVGGTNNKAELIRARTESNQNFLLLSCRFLLSYFF